MKTPRESQKDYVTRLRKESVLDKSIPITITAPAKPEEGPDYEAYYTEKLLRTGSYGELWSLNPMVERENA